MAIISAKVVPDVEKSDIRHEQNINDIRHSILAEVEKCVCGGIENRNKTPESTSKIIAKFWTLYLQNRDGGTEISEPDVDVMMILLKISRIITGYGGIDNWLDIAGYATLGCEADFPDGPQAKNKK